MTKAQVWDPDQYAHHARFVSDLGAPVVALLAPVPGEYVLDLGCGDGVIARELLHRGCHVVAVDASPAQIEAARRLGLDARIMDGEALDFDGAFDAVFSNAAIHWMKRDPDAVISGAFRALVPGGRFVAEFGGKGCVETIRRALIEALGRRGVDGAALDPWYFPDVEEYGARLTAAGFRVELIETFPRPTPLPTNVAGWLETFAQTFLAGLPLEARTGFVEEICTVLKPSLCSADGRWTADYVRLRFVARKD
ncbi:MAG TPA: methyltransferase domain-containing protein [Polyangiaceae bacterium]